MSVLDEIKLIKLNAFMTLVSTKSNAMYSYLEHLVCYHVNSQVHLDKFYLKEEKSSHQPVSK